MYVLFWAIHSLTAKTCYLGSNQIIKWYSKHTSHACHSSPIGQLRTTIDLLQSRTLVWESNDRKPLGLRVVNKAGELDHCPKLHDNEFLTAGKCCSIIPWVAVITCLTCTGKDHVRLGWTRILILMKKLPRMTKLITFAKSCTLSSTRSTYLWQRCMTVSRHFLSFISARSLEAHLENNAVVLVKKIG